MTCPKCNGGPLWREYIGRGIRSRMCIYCGYREFRDLQLPQVIRKCKRCGKEMVLYTEDRAMVCKECERKPKKVTRVKGICKRCGREFFNKHKRDYCPVCLEIVRKEHTRKIKRRLYI